VLLLPSSSQLALLPLFLSSVAILSSIIGSSFLKQESLKSGALRGLMVSAALSAVGFYPVVSKMAAGQTVPIFNLYGAAAVGLAAAPAIVFGLQKRSVKNFLPLILVIADAALSFWLAGGYGAALSAVAMLAVVAGSSAFASLSPSGENASRCRVAWNGLIGLALVSAFEYQAANLLGVGKWTLVAGWRFAVGLVIGIMAYGLLLFVASWIAKKAAGRTAVKAAVLLLLALLVPLFTGWFLGIRVLGGLVAGAVLAGMAGELFSNAREWFDKSIKQSGAKEKMHPVGLPLFFEGARPLAGSLVLAMGVTALLMVIFMGGY
jgi:Na+/H+-translocating membrane pyrophosphatase